MLIAIDHIQLSIPKAADALARARGFYAGVLGLGEVPRPPELSARPGLWFESTGVKLHLAEDDDFRAARRAHPAFAVADLEALLARCRAAGVEATPAPPYLGAARAHIHDPFGNRIELMAATPRSTP